MSPRRVRSGPRELVVADAMIALVLSAWMVTDIARGSVDGDPAVLIPLFLVATVSLTWRRKAPLAVAVAAAVPSAVHALASGNPPVGGPGFLAVLIALYSVGAYAPTRRALVGLAVIAAAYVIHEVQNPGITNETQLWAALFFAVIAGAIFVAGVYVRRHRQMRALERAVDDRAHAAVADERSRIARELHDVVSHSVSVMVLQAEAAEEVLERRPERAGEPLRRIQGTGREALAEMRRMLDVLGPAEEAALAPQPGLERVPELVDKLGDAGLPVTVRVEGAPVRLPAGLDLAAYRVVQEALTNVIKHARDAEVDVLVRYAPGQVEIVVCDDGHGGAAGDGGGRGLAGMRERVALYDGTIEAGARSGGGFRVRACLPVP